MALTTRQDRFVQEYLKKPVGSDAAIAAGYAPKHANRSAAQLMAHPDVAAAIAAGQAAISAKNAVTADWIVSELRAIAVSKVKGDSVKALELLGKNLSMFKDTLQHVGPNGGPVAMTMEIRFVRPARNDESSNGH